MKGMTREREAQIKSLPYEEAMRMCWMWIKQGVIDSPGEFIRAVQLIQSTKECRSAVSALRD